MFDDSQMIIVNDSTARLKFERRSRWLLFATSILIVAVVMQFANWGGFAFEALPLQVGDALHLNSRAGQERLAQICLDLKNLECTERQYANLATDRAGWLRLSRFQSRRGEYSAAVEGYRKFFESGGEEVDVAYDYAFALGQAGRIDEASKYFDFVLAAKPEVLQITVTQNYVRLLIANNRLEQALKVIREARKRTHSPIMATEFDSLRAKHTGRAS